MASVYRAKGKIQVKLSWQAGLQKQGVVAKKEDIDLWGLLI